VINFTLSKAQIQDIIFNNRYKLDDKSSFSNLDELSLIINTGEVFGLEVDKEKAKKIIDETFNKQNKPSQLSNRYNGAILQIKGQYTVNSLFSLRTEARLIKGVMFIFQETLINRQHRILAKKLIGEKAVKLFPGCDEEYLYEILTEVTESHLFETLKKLASGLPIFQVSFDSDGSFTLEEMGNIS